MVPLPGGHPAAGGGGGQGPTPAQGTLGGVLPNPAVPPRLQQAPVPGQCPGSARRWARGRAAMGRGSAVPPGPGPPAGPPASPARWQPGREHRARPCPAVLGWEPAPPRSPSSASSSSSCTRGLRARHSPGSPPVPRARHPLGWMPDPDSASLSSPLWFGGGGARTPGFHRSSTCDPPPTLPQFPSGTSCPPQALNGVPAPPPAPPAPHQASLQEPEDIFRDTPPSVPPQSPQQGPLSRGCPTDTPCCGHSVTHGNPPPQDTPTQPRAPPPPHGACPGWGDGVHPMLQLHRGPHIPLHPLGWCQGGLAQHPGVLP